MLHARFVRSPLARGRIDRVDPSEALALPGVRAVFTAADLNGDAKQQWHTSTESAWALTLSLASTCSLTLGRQALPGALRSVTPAIRVRGCVARQFRASRCGSGV